jgi:predicted metal-dependent phosphoesterase TrpH/PAS domain-containing protein
MEGVKLNLHCHSSVSDGLLAPAELAGRLADAGAAVAALTDHDSTAGSAAFRDALARRGVACVDAVELTTFCSFGEIHLLGYGIDPASPELAAALAALGDGTDQELRGFIARVRRFGARPNAGRLDSAEAVGLIHRAGGLAVLAHPLDIGFASGDLDGLLDYLGAAGLDGLEAVYGPYSGERRRSLAAAAAARGLAVSAGSDFHAPDDAARPLTMEVDAAVWSAFRDRLLSRPAAAHDRPGPGRPAGLPPGTPGRPAATGRAFGLYSARVIAASLAGFGLVVVALFAVSIPFFKASLLDRKKDMIRELTAEAVSLIAEYAADADAGRSTLAEAQTAALTHLRGLRYGREGKDYFWVTDLLPRMLLHPFRPELEGRDLSDFRDDNGLRVFYEFTRAVRDDDEGYVEYLWQWKDDADRIVPKLSFVKRFLPWGWIIGTGVYLDDVEAESDALSGRLVWLSALIALVLAALLAYIARESLRADRARLESESAVRESQARYRALVEASSEGMAIVIDGRCSFANGPFRDLVGYGAAETALIPLAELIVPFPGEEDAALAFLAALPGNAGGDADPAPAGPTTLACRIRRRTGDPAEAVLQASAFALGGKRGAVVSVKETRPDAAGRGEAELKAALRRLEAELGSADEAVPVNPGGPPRIGLGATIRQAAERLDRAPGGALVVTGPDGTDIGLIRDEDLRRRVLAAGRSPDGPLGPVITAPLPYLPVGASYGQVERLMEEAGIGHVALRGADDAVAALIDRADLSRRRTDSFAALAAAAAVAADAAALARIRRRLAARADRSAASGFPARQLAAQVSAVLDAFSARLCALAEAELGPPPTGYAFLALGSLGRSEALPASDQDNAIVYADPPAGRETECAAYFGRLGAAVCSGLTAAGIPPCPGGVMADRPRWNLSLKAWTERYADWIGAPDPEELLAFTVSADFRAAYGDAGLAAELRRRVAAALAEAPNFFVHAARDALRRKAAFPPAGAIFAAADAEVDLKEAAATLSGYARLYALRDGVSDANTYRRFEALAAAGSFGPELAAECLEVYPALTALRLRRGPRVGLKSCSPVEEALLRQAGALANLIQKKIAFDFPASAF